MTQLVRVTARKDFTFKGAEFKSGETLEVPALVAVQMGQQNVSYKRVKVTLPEIKKPNTRRRRAMPVVDGAESVPPARTEHSVEDIIPANTYERKDLRAED